MKCKWLHDQYCPSIIEYLRLTDRNGIRAYRIAWTWLLREQLLDILDGRSGHHEISASSEFIDFSSVGFLVKCTIFAMLISKIWEDWHVEVWKVGNIACTIVLWDGESMENLNSQSPSETMTKKRSHEISVFWGTFFCTKSLTWTILSSFHVSYPSRSLFVSVDWPVPNTSLGGWSVCERKLWCLWWWIHWSSRCFPDVEVYSPGIFRNPGESLEILTQDFYFRIKCRGPDESPNQLESYHGLGNHVLGGGVVNTTSASQEAPNWASNGVASFRFFWKKSLQSI